MRILIVEDNMSLLKQMQEHLRQAGYYVDAAYDGGTGEELAYVNEYDAVLLDLNLPGKDGLEILAYLRGEKVDTPVIIVTARDEVSQRVRGLQLGADDYLTKPFDFEELEARIQAVLRRFMGRTNPAITVGKLKIDPSSRTAEYDSKRLTLKPKEFDILEYIAHSHPAVVSTEKISEHVYDGEYDPFSSILRVHIASLKNTLLAQSGVPVIMNIRGKGYYLCVDESEQA